jgi:Zn-dependent peptidase ImmA (M78 family)
VSLRIRVVALARAGLACPPELGALIRLLSHDRTDVHKLTVREAEMEATKLLETAWWPAQELPVDPYHLASGLGIAIRNISMAADESGSLVIAPDETPVMSLNSNDSENRRRFTCAHEIGHYTRRSRDPIHQRFVDYRDDLAGLGSDSGEIFANQFAAALLMPSVKVIEFHRFGLTARDMAHRFGTSVQAMEIRLRNLRLM